MSSSNVSRVITTLGLAVAFAATAAAQLPGTMPGPQRATSSSSQSVQPIQPSQIPTTEGSNPNVGAALLPGLVTPEYVIGPTDVVSVVVYNMPELNRTEELNEQGMLRLRYLRAPIPASGRTEDELAEEIREVLQEQQILLDPQVDVYVVRVQSRPVFVTGDVHSPGTIQAAGDVHLLDALMLAGGPSVLYGRVIINHGAENPVGGNDAAAAAAAASRSPAAGADADATVPPPADQQTISLANLLSGTDPAANIAVHAGDYIRVLGEAQVYAAGDFNRPGAYGIPDGGTLTVSELLALAGGWGADAHVGSAYLIHHPERGNPVVTKLNLGDIVKRKAPDPVLAGGDIVSLSSNHLKGLGLMGYSGFIGTGIAALTYLAIYH